MRASIDVKADQSRILDYSSKNVTGLFFFADVAPAVG